MLGECLRLLFEGRSEGGCGVNDTLDMTMVENDTTIIISKCQGPLKLDEPQHNLFQLLVQAV